jgi:hypothetical protein
VAGERDAVCVVQESIQDGIGHGGFPDVGMPLVDGQLAGDDGGTAAVTIFEDFEQFPSVAVLQGEQAPIKDWKTWAK